jgi:hypothetical protein
MPEGSSKAAWVVAHQSLLVSSRIRHVGQSPLPPRGVVVCVVVCVHSFSTEHTTAVLRPNRYSVLTRYRLLRRPTAA